MYRDPHQIHFIEYNPQCTNRTFEHRRESHIKGIAGLTQRLTGGARLFDAFLRKINVGPTGEKIGFVPHTFAMANQHEFIHRTYLLIVQSPKSKVQSPKSKVESLSKSLLRIVLVEGDFSTAFRRCLRVNLAGDPVCRRDHGIDAAALTLRAHEPQPVNRGPVRDARGVHKRRKPAEGVVLCRRALAEVLRRHNHSRLRVRPQAGDARLGIGYQLVRIVLAPLRPGPRRQPVRRDGVDRHCVAAGGGHLRRVERGHVDDKAIASPAGIRQACEGSLRRLNTDYIDVYLFHDNGFPPEKAQPVRDTLDALVEEGKIRTYGWSTDFPKSAEFFAQSEHCAAIEVELNVLDDNPAILDLCERYNLAAVNRGLLAMGLLTGKYAAGTGVSIDDVRGQKSPEWMRYFKDGRPNPEFLKKIAAVREVLTSNGRTLAQGALAWLWARSENNIPIPGFRTVKQVEENAKAMQFGPLTQSQIEEIDALIR